MFVFGLAFSLPFVVFSFFPALMKKMPKSGGWLNMVKVVFAFILLAFSMKYLSAVDAWFGWGIISRPLVISVWIVIAALLGFYLLGKIRTPHDSEVTHVGAGRMISAIISFTFAIFLIPGLFGAPLTYLSALYLHQVQIHSQCMPLLLETNPLRLLQKNPLLILTIVARVNL
jgi:thiol:disulfide interchange protein DsbD